MSDNVSRDKVSAEMRQAVLARDRECFVAMLDGDAHTCFDAMGNKHNSRDVSKLQIDHVHDRAGGVKGKRAPSRLSNMVAMCAGVNVPGPSRRVRIAERRYLKELAEHGQPHLAMLRAIIAAGQYQLPEMPAALQGNK